MTEEDGSNLNKLFADLFIVLDKNERDDVPSYLKEFPYVNGQLFTEPHTELEFSAKSRKLIIECGELLNWAKINPDIFGSMIQAVASEESRSYLGMHYTSVPNIMKVIKPLFLDKLNQSFLDAYDDYTKLENLLTRIGKIKFFDPACGSGNFLIITYKELRRMEINIIKRLQELLGEYLYVPSVTLSQFYGIEIEDFAHDVAKLSLWIAEHQMNEELKNEVHNAVRPTLPLHTAGIFVVQMLLGLSGLRFVPHKDLKKYMFLVIHRILVQKNKTKNINLICYQFLEKSRMVKCLIIFLLGFTLVLNTLQLQMQNSTFSYCFYQFKLPLYQQIQLLKGNRFLSYGMSYSSLEFKSILPINLLNGRIMLK